MTGDGLCAHDWLSRIEKSVATALVVGAAMTDLAVASDRLIGQNVSDTSYATSIITYLDTRFAGGPATYGASFANRY